MGEKAGLAAQIVLDSFAFSDNAIAQAAAAASVIVLATQTEQFDLDGSETRAILNMAGSVANLVKSFGNAEFNNAAESLDDFRY